MPLGWAFRDIFGLAMEKCYCGGAAGKSRSFCLAMSLSVRIRGRVASQEDTSSSNQAMRPGETLTGLGNHPSRTPRQTLVRESDVQPALPYTFEPGISRRSWRPW